jgi:glycosyltransferase involved in cell wall biosynthesis
VTKPKNAVHVCYCYNPTRFIWTKEAYLSEERLAFFKNLYLGLFLKKMRALDLKAAKDADHIIGISFTVKERIKRIYGRDADVIYCPVECGRFSPSRGDDGYFLIVSRLLGHKRIDVAIRAFNTLGLKLKVVGSGPQYAVLKKMAKGNIEFIGSVERDEVAKLYSRCRALVYPQEEDFGIAPLEANASGKPVIAFAKGGVLETMNHNTALFFHEQTPESLAEAVKRMDIFKFNPERLRANAMLFDKSVFISRLRAKIDQLYQLYHAGKGR